MPENLSSNRQYFNTRFDAANKLLEILPKELLKTEEWILLALSKGGVEIASFIANELDLDFDIFIVEPIFAPQNSECEIAMVSETKDIVMIDALIDSFEIDENYIYQKAQEIHDSTILQHINLFRVSLPLSDINSRSILLIDEGCESGLSTMCAIKSILNLQAKKVSVAVPIIAEDLYHNLDLIVDNIFANHKIEHFISTEYYYEELEKLKDKKVLKILKSSSHYLPNKKESK